MINGFDNQLHKSNFQTRGWQWINEDNDCINYLKRTNSINSGLN